MYIESMMIYFQIPRTNQELQVILIDQYINRDVNGKKYSIVGNQAVNEVHFNLMALMKN